MAAPNITPDRETGIGGWTDEQFDQALRGGKLPDGSRMYPAMPYPYYTRMTKEDVLAIRGYLRTVNAVRQLSGRQPTTLSVPDPIGNGFLGLAVFQ